MKAAEAMVKCLEMEGVKVVFGYPGAAICPFYDALTHSEIRHILVRQEQNAGHAASGFARITNSPAVCIATSGPGATNLITAIATAYMDSVPLVIITGQVSCDQIGRDVFQEVDITGAVEPFVKHSFLIKDANSLPEIFKQAFYIAGTGRKGPVLIDVPMDIQDININFSYPKNVEIRAYKPSSKGNALQIKRVVEAILKAKNPLICSGGGVFSANACTEISQLAKKANIPVITTMMGIGTFPSDSPLNFGMIGMHGVKSANYAMTKCDLILLVGARVGDRAVKSPSFLAETAKIIHIDIDPAEIGKNIKVNIPVVGDAKLILAQILEQIPEMSHDEWFSELEKNRIKPTFSAALKGFVNPREFISKLSEKLPENTVVTADVGQNQIWTSNYFKIKQGRFLTSGGMGTMGYSLPAAVGAKLADSDAPVVTICGDGSFQMQMMELGTICQNNIPIKIIIMTNNRLGMVRELQTKNFSDNLVAIFLDGSPDFIKLAAAYGIPAERISDISEADEAIDRLISAKTPYLIECQVSPDEPTL
ncbi:MAG: biosynthetic-type acetolactate synthase large subunit [Oscillospiraceae bacterium]